MIDTPLADLTSWTSTKQACRLLGQPRASHYRRCRPPKLGPPVPRPAPPNKLTEPDRQHVLSVLRSPEFCDHYNHVHRHSGIGLHTPASVHYGTASEIRAQRSITLDVAYNSNPRLDRFRVVEAGFLGFQMIDQDKIYSDINGDKPEYEAPKLTVLTAARHTEGGLFSFTHETTNGTTS